MKTFFVTFGQRSALREHYVAIEIKDYAPEWKRKQQEYGWSASDLDSAIARSIADEHFGPNYSVVYEEEKFTSEWFSGGLLFTITEAYPNLVSVTRLTYHPRVLLDGHDPGLYPVEQFIAAVEEDGAEHVRVDVNQNGSIGGEETVYTILIWLDGHKVRPPHIEISDIVGWENATLAAYSAFLAVKPDRK